MTGGNISHMVYAVILMQLTLINSTLPPHHLTSMCVPPHLVQSQFLPYPVRGMSLPHSAPNKVISSKRQSFCHVNNLSVWKNTRRDIFLGCLPQEFRKTVSSSIASGMTQSCSGYFITSNHNVNILSLRFMSPESSKNNTAGLAQC